LSETDCTEVLQEIELYLDGELSHERTVRLVDHLGHCSPCQDRAEFHQKLRSIVRAKCQAETPAHLAERIRSAIRSKLPPGPSARA
jgi:mycothiol system anti-sigma-R factor